MRGEEADFEMLVEDVGDPCEEAEGGHVAQGGRDRRCHVVRVDVQVSRQRIVCVLV